MRIPITLLALSLALASSAHTAHEQAAEEFFAPYASNHTNNWAVLVCSSRYWFNYRVRMRTLATHTLTQR